MKHITVDICTKGRYYTTLPLTLMSVALQSKAPDKIYIYDDNEEKVDLRNIPTYQYIFNLLDKKGIEWEVLFGIGKGQHYGHQKIQELAEDLVWRIDDDEIAEPDVLESLLEKLTDDYGAVGSLVLDPKAKHDGEATGKIQNIYTEPNRQWLGIIGFQDVEHLYSSFLYRKGLVNYDLSMSPVAHREETMFTHEIFRLGYKLGVVGEVTTWHFRNPEGGIRSSPEEYFLKDEKHFTEKFNEWNGKKIVYLDSGKGDHICFKYILPELKKKYKEVVIACCYPEIFEGENVISLEEGKKLVDVDRHNIYKFMMDNNWKSELKDAYAKLYLNS